MRARPTSTMTWREELAPSGIRRSLTCNSDKGHTAESVWDCAGWDPSSAVLVVASFASS